jgi:sigma-B regulation protein RsbU (phosphoserine phosphatase)
MTMTKGILAAASRDPVDLPGLAGALNSQLYAAGRKKTFVTMALGRLDVETRRLEYLRAGHNSILWRRALAGTCEYRKPRGVGLGLATSRTFDRSVEVDTLALGVGDAVVFYSDGITEAMNSSRELFGEERLEAVVQRHAGLDAAGMEMAILSEVRRFMAGEPPHDDMTLFVLKA